MHAIRRETRRLAASARLRAPREPPCASAPPRTSAHLHASGAAAHPAHLQRRRKARPLLLYQLNVDGLRDLLDQRKVAQASAHRNVSAGSHRARQSLLDSRWVVEPD